MPSKRIVELIGAFWQAFMFPGASERFRMPPGKSSRCFFIDHRQALTASKSPCWDAKIAPFLTVLRAEKFKKKTEKK